MFAMTAVREFMPDPRVMDVLRGKISEPVQTISHKPGEEGQLVTVRIALEGPGMYGLTDWEDNQKWSGINDHTFQSTRNVLYLGEGMNRAGHSVNLWVMGNGMPRSHPGRRQWEEARDYPEVVPNAAEKAAMFNEVLGVRLIAGKVPEEVLELVASLAFMDEYVRPGFYQSLEHRLSILADHRTTDRWLPLHIRMGGFIWKNFFDENKMEPITQATVQNTLGELFTRERNYRLGLTGSKGVTVDEASDILEDLGANSDSPRSTLRLQLDNLLKDVATEAELIQAGVNIDDINDTTVPMPKWEDDLRRGYVGAARESIVERLSFLNKALRDEEETSSSVWKIVADSITTDFPTNTWWGRYANDLYQESLQKV